MSSWLLNHPKRGNANSPIKLCPENSAELDFGLTKFRVEDDNTILYQHTRGNITGAITAKQYGLVYLYLTTPLENAIFKGPVMMPKDEHRVLAGDLVQFLALSAMFKGPDHDFIDRVKAENALDLPPAETERYKLTERYYSGQHGDQEVTPGTLIEWGLMRSNMNLLLRGSDLIIGDEAGKWFPGQESEKFKMAFSNGSKSNLDVLKEELNANLVEGQGVPTWVKSIGNNTGLAVKANGFNFQVSKGKDAYTISGNISGVLNGHSLIRDVAFLNAVKRARAGMPDFGDNQLLPSEAPLKEAVAKGYEKLDLLLGTPVPKAPEPMPELTKEELSIRRKRQVTDLPIF